MKALLVLAAATAATAANTAPQVCRIPSNYVEASATACTGAKAGYTVTGFCATPWGVNTIAGVTSTATATSVLSSTTSTLFDATADLGFCTVPSDVGEWAAANQGQVGFLNAACVDDAGGAAYTAGANNLDLKGAAITCATGYYASAGTEGATLCADTTAGYWANADDLATGLWVPGFGPSSFVSGTWALTTPTLVCAKPCTIAAPLCNAAGTAVSDNVYLTGTGIVNTCQVKPGTTVTVMCKSNPWITYTGTCTTTATTADNTADGTLTWNTQPACGAVDSVSTGAYAVAPLANGATQAAGMVTEFTTASSTLTATSVNTASQWGGLVREQSPFLDGTFYNVEILNCPTDATRGDCVQKVVNYWRCHDLTIDTASVCLANGVRIACPTHTNGHRCPSSSKKGLLGLLGLLGLIPLLLLVLLCCLLLPCLLRRRKTEGDVHFATFDPHAAPIAGSIAPGTACYAPSIGAVPTAVY